jgi:glycosyltransferase involved in cell wall biosynthesis
MKISFLTSIEDFEGYGGGNQRSRCFFEALRNIVNGEHTLECIAIPFSTFDELEVEGVTNQHMANDIEFAMRLTWATKNGHESTEDLLSKIEDTDYILIDNCYHFPLIEVLKENHTKALKTIYLSHNYESILKSEIAESLSWETDSKRRYLDFVRALEESTWSKSDFRIVCSEDDAKKLNEGTEVPLKYEVIPNGANIKGRTVSEHGPYLAAMGFESYVLFVSSGHPPNVKGFLDMFGSDFGFIPPNSRVVIVGTSGPIIRDLFQGTKYWETFRHRVTILNQTTEDELENLYSHTSAILLPILQGSGTSIKAIEAILTGKKIIGTEFAFRGLPSEIYRSPQVSVANITQDFRSEVIRCLRNDILDFEVSEIAESYQWSSLIEQSSELLHKITQIGVE